MTNKLILASASKARLGVLQSAGIHPKVLVSNIDEEKIIQNLPKNKFEPELQVSLIALGKALEILKNIHINTLEESKQNIKNTENEYVYNNELLLIACDSMLEFNQQMLGKPKNEELAISRAKTMRGKTTTLHTGHVAIKLSIESIISIDNNILKLPKIKTKNDLDFFIKTFPIQIAINCDSTKVTFANTTDKEIEKYVSTKEPLYVAGGFTIDGYGSAFIEKIEGDYNNVIGISPRVIRNLCKELDLEYTDFWE